MTGPDKAKRGIPPKSDFNAWYPAIVEIADLVDKRYPIKGMDVWRPYGWKAMKRIDALTHAEMERTGHDERRWKRKSRRNGGTTCPRYAFTESHARIISR